MNAKFVYGQYIYTDGTEKEFRYPAEKEEHLKKNGETVTIQIKDYRQQWVNRRGIVVWGGGNFVVRPA